MYTGMATESLQTLGAMFGLIGYITHVTSKVPCVHHGFRRKSGTTTLTITRAGVCSGLSAAPSLLARSCWLSISGRSCGYPLPRACNPSASFAFQCAPQPCAPRPRACVSTTVRSRTSIADMHMDDNMVKAMGAAIAAAMARDLNNANNDNSNNQGAPQAPARGALDAVAAADGAQPP